MQQDLSTKTKISYGVGDLGLALTGAMLGLLFAKFLTDAVGLKPAQVAIAVFIGRTWDWINDPIQGYITDHIRTRWGRRRPFLLFGAIPFGIVFLMLWWIPPITSDVGLLVYYTAAYFLFDTVVTLIFIPYVALTPEITPDYDGRTSLTSFRMFFSLTGSLLGTVIPLFILGGAEIGPEKKGLIFTVGAALALVSSIPFLITFAGTQENTDYQRQETPKLQEVFRGILRNPPYLSAVVIYLATVTGLEVISGTSLYFMQYRLQQPQLASVTTLIMFVIAISAIPFWTWVSKRSDKVRGYAGAMMLLIVVLLIYGSLGKDAPAALVMVFAGLAGFGLSAGQTMPWAILPDTVEYGEYVTGQRYEGMFYSLMALARKIASSITLPLVLFLLDRSGYVPNVAAQAPGVIQTIGFLFAGIPSLLFLVGLIAAIRYPLSRERFNEIRQVLAERHQGSD